MDEAADPIARFNAAPIPAHARFLTLEQLRPESCRWPIGESPDPYSLRYCGADAPGLGLNPYCACHSTLAGASKRKSKRPAKERAAQVASRPRKTHFCVKHGQTLGRASPWMVNASWR